MNNYRVNVEILNIRSGPGIDYEDEGDLVLNQIVSSPDVKDWIPIIVEDEEGNQSVSWVNKKYLVLDNSIEEPISTIKPDVTSGEPIWIQWARKQIGQREKPGIQDNPIIQAWYHLTTLPSEYWHDSTAWCAVFVNAALMLNNIKTIRSARAFDWLKYGEGVNNPKVGDLVIFDFSHIAFYINDAGGGRINCLGGNQSDMVNITSFSKDNVEAYRRVNV